MIEDSATEWHAMPTEVPLPAPLEQRTALGLGILGAALLLGLLGDALLRALPWGLNMVLWVGSLVVSVVALLSWQRLRAADEGRWLVIPLLFFAGCIAWRSSEVLVSLSLLAVAVSLGLAGYYLMRGSMHDDGLLGYTIALFVTGITTMFGPFALAFSDVKWGDLPRTRTTNLVAPVLRGLLIALPLLFIFGTLFMAADAVFEGIVSDLLDIDIPELVSHLVLIGLFGWLSAGFLRQLLLDYLSRTDAESTPRFQSPGLLGPIEIAIILGTLNLLFLAFVVVQFRYFFGGADVVASSITMTYAEYARRGFFELVTVAALVLPLLLAIHWLAKRDTPRKQRLFQLLAGSLILLLFIIMISAVQRMRLYQLEFGLTELRLYTSVFMGWLAVLFVWFILTVLRERRERFIIGALITGFVVIALLQALNPDAFIVRTNVARGQSALQAQPFDRHYVTTLSDDAVPALVASLDNMSEEDRCYIAAQLLRQEASSEPPDWRTWNWSRYRARSAVAGQMESLQTIACP